MFNENEMGKFLKAGQKPIAEPHIIKGSGLLNISNALTKLEEADNNIRNEIEKES
ncbi:hypothetical protein [Listeria booriae]|uniref:hypothetical protein n=1 Tax=Listeria booriae TaxID=1552123 RepID=UPI0016260235|nr:hypothetical protein [Listeria booriae]MBC2392015.1 hypothetical protein [Listeria booriae]